MGTRVARADPYSPVSVVSDRVLWDRARQGDAAAFGELFEHHAGKIYNYCFRRTADWALAEDLTSTTFLIAWRGVGRESLRAESALPLLYGIATNALRNRKRSIRRGRDAFARLPLPRAADPTSPMMRFNEPMTRRQCETCSSSSHACRDANRTCSLSASGVAGGASAALPPRSAGQRVNEGREA